MRALAAHNCIQYACHILLAFLCSVVLAEVDGEITPITLVPADSFNLQVDAQTGAAYLITSLATPAQNWFAGSFSNLPTDRKTTIGLNLTGKGASSATAQVGKWQGLHPVMTYAEPSRLESFDCFYKDTQGRWISLDPLKRGAERVAGTGIVPEQLAMPAVLAEAFLSPDGRQWTPWREVDAIEVLPALNVFRMTQRFLAPSATVAMRIPFTDTYLQAFIARLQQAQLPGVNIDTLGTTPGGRPLQLIRIEDPDGSADLAHRKTILVIGREHGTEAASSWVALGLLNHLISDSASARSMRKGITWLLAPIQDPDGSTQALFDRMTDRFGGIANPDTPPEIYLYARYFCDYIYSGRSLDIAVSLHNVEANECANVYCPFVDSRQVETTNAVTQRFYSALRRQGYAVDEKSRPWDVGSVDLRLFGWCASRFATLDLAYEVNDRYPQHRLSLPELQRIGAILGDTLASWCADDAGQRWHQRVSKILRMKRLEQAAYFERAGYGPAERTKSDLIMRAF
ncbi:MAG: M14 family zinc carboxypeptidase [Armatimonadota bacterium]